jgi:hypothetical protein
MTKGDGAVCPHALECKIPIEVDFVRDFRTPGSRKPAVGVKHAVPLETEVKREN